MKSIIVALLNIMDISVIIVSSIAAFCGIFAGALGSPGFALIVPLLITSGVFPTFQLALGAAFMGVVLPDVVNAFIYIMHNKELINFRLNIFFTLVFAIFSGFSVYFSKYIKDCHKFYIAGFFQLCLGIWYIIYATKHK